MLETSAGVRSALTGSASPACEHARVLLVHKTARMDSSVEVSRNISLANLQTRFSVRVLSMFSFGSVEKCSSPNAHPPKTNLIANT